MLILSHCDLSNCISHNIPWPLSDFSELVKLPKNFESRRVCRSARRINPRTGIDATQTHNRDKQGHGRRPCLFTAQSLFAAQFALTDLPRRSQRASRHACLPPPCHSRRAARIARVGLALRPQSLRAAIAEAVVPFGERDAHQVALSHKGRALSSCIPERVGEGRAGLRVLRAPTVGSVERARVQLCWERQRRVKPEEPLRGACRRNRGRLRAGSEPRAAYVDTDRVPHAAVVVAAVQERAARLWSRGVAWGRVGSRGVAWGRVGSHGASAAGRRGRMGVTCGHVKRTGCGPKRSACMRFVMLLPSSCGACGPSAGLST